MAWLEISFEIEESRIEEVSEKLEALGAQSVTYLDACDNPILEPMPGTTPLWNKTKIVGLFADAVNISPIMQSLKSFLPQANIQCEPLIEKDWSRTWLEHYRPMSFGKKLWIVPESSSLPEGTATDAVVIKMDPGLAFGTGTHPTTALCLSWLDAHPPLNETVVDYGCGSGILGIAAMALGAQKVYAIDHDSQALISTKENARKNHLDENQVITFLPKEVPQTLCAHTVLANILAEPLIALAPNITSCCEMSGNLVLAGLLTSQAEDVKKAYAKWFSLEVVMEKEDWVLLAGTRLA